MNLVADALSREKFRVWTFFVFETTRARAFTPATLLKVELWIQSPRNSELESMKIGSEIKFGYLLLQKVLTLKEKKVIRRKYKTNMTKIEVVTVETQVMYGSGSPWTSSHGKLDIFLSR